MSIHIGLDIGGTKCAAVVGSDSGQILARCSGSTPAKGRFAGDFLLRLIESACFDASITPSGVNTLGVSYGGPVDSAGHPLTPPNLPQWQGFDLRALLTQCFICPIRIVNDANATALAEHRWGAGRGCENLIYLTLGTGIGAGIIIDGRLACGRDGLAGEVGHMVLDPAGPICACGKRGCLEALSSGTAIGRAARERYGDAGMTAHDIVRQADQGDGIAREILQTASRWLGLGIANLLHVLNPERILLGTLADAAGVDFMTNVRESVQQYAWPSLAEGVLIEPAGLGSAAQDLAALAAAIAAD